MMFVARAAFVLRSVGRIIDRRDKKGFGTGFLVAPNVLMTNEHVLGTAARAGSASVQFQYELDMGLRELTGHEFRLDPERLFLVDRDLDFALVAVADCSEAGRPPARREFGYLPLAGVEGKIHVGQPVNIIQHPDGGRKQIVFRESVLKLLPKNDRHRRPLHRRHQARLLRIAGLQRFMGGDRAPPLGGAGHRRGRPAGSTSTGIRGTSGTPGTSSGSPTRVSGSRGSSGGSSSCTRQATGSARELLGSVLEVGRRAAEEDPFATDAPDRRARSRRPARRRRRLIPCAAGPARAGGLRVVPDPAQRHRLARAADARLSRCGLRRGAAAGGRRARSARRSAPWRCRRRCRPPR